MRFRLVETITQNNKIYKKIQEIISNEYNGKKYEDLSDSEKRKVVDKAIEEFDTRNVLKPSKTVYTNELLEHGIDERENPFVTFMENIKIALPTTIIKVLIDKTHVGYGKYRIDPRRDDFIYDKRLYNKMDSTGDIKDTIYKLNALAYVNNEKVEKDDRRIIVDDLIGKSVERIKNILSGIQVEGSEEFNMLEVIIKYLGSIKETKEWAQELEKDQKNILKYDINSRTKFLDNLDKIIGKSIVDKIPNYKEIFMNLKDTPELWNKFLKIRMDYTNNEEFIKDFVEKLNELNKGKKQEDSDKTQSILNRTVNDFMPKDGTNIGKFILENILATTEKYQSLNTQDKNSYEKALNDSVVEYGQVFERDPQNGKENAKTTELGKLLNTPANEEELGNIVFEWLKNLVDKNGLLNNIKNDNNGTKVYRMKKPNFDYNGDSI